MEQYSSLLKTVQFITGKELLKLKKKPGQFNFKSAPTKRFIIQDYELSKKLLKTTKNRSVWERGTSVSDRHICLQKSYEAKSNAKIHFKARKTKRCKTPFVSVFWRRIGD